MDKLAYIKSCKKCDLNTVRRMVVLGRGSLPADILIIGEGPGKTEDLIGKAFIGQAGKLLDTMIQEACLDIYSIYMTNSVLCHPCDSFGGNNRTPTDNEVMQCMSNISDLIKMCSPRLIVCAGDIPNKFYGKTKIRNRKHPVYFRRAGKDFAHRQNYRGSKAGN